VTVVHVSKHLFVSVSHAYAPQLEHAEVAETQSPPEHANPGALSALDVHWVRQTLAAPQA
jgi:hypothetical protein